VLSSKDGSVRLKRKAGKRKCQRRYNALSYWDRKAFLSAVTIAAGGSGREGGRERGEEAEGRPCDSSVVADMEPRVGGKITRGP
jgi:hypothetical protein